MNEFEAFLSWQGSEEDWFSFINVMFTAISYLSGDHPTQILVDTRDDPVYAGDLARISPTLDFEAWTVTAVASTAEAAEEMRRELDHLGVMSHVDGVIPVQDRAALPFADTAFDVVLALGIMDDLAGDETRRRIISEFRRVLKPGGYLILSARTITGHILSALLDADASIDLNTLATLDTGTPGGTKSTRAQIDELYALLTEGGLDPVDWYAVEGMTSWIPTTWWNRIRTEGEETYNVVRWMIFSLIDDPALAGAAKEILVVGKRAN